MLRRTGFVFAFVDWKPHFRMDLKPVILRNVVFDWETFSLLSLVYHFEKISSKFDHLHVNISSLISANTLKIAPLMPRSVGDTEVFLLHIVLSFLFVTFLLYYCPQFYAVTIQTLYLSPCIAKNRSAFVVADFLRRCFYVYHCKRIMFTVIYRIICFAFGTPVVLVAYIPAIVPVATIGFVAPCALGVQLVPVLYLQI